MKYKLITAVLLSCIKGLGYFDWTADDVEHTLTYWMLNFTIEHEHHKPLYELQTSMRSRGPQKIEEEHIDYIICIGTQFLTMMDSIDLP